MIARWVEKRRQKMKAKKREIDRRILWPVIKENLESDLGKAKAAFALHAAIDPAWQNLTEDEMREELPWVD